VHRLQFSKEETDLLATRLNALIESGAGTMVGVLIFGSDLECCLTHIKSDPLTPIEHQYIYQSVKENVDQCYWQVMYHTPLSKIPLLINHKDPLVVTIVKWRLEIAR
jgi:hypothetical protein